MSTIKIHILAGILALPLLAPLAAQPAGTPAQGPSRSQAVSLYFNRPASDIADLRAAGFGFGEIVKILVIAEMSRRAPADLLAENSKGLGWGALSLKLGLNPVFVKLRVDSARRDLDIKVRPAGESKGQKQGRGAKEAL